MKIMLVFFFQRYIMKTLYKELFNKTNTYVQFSSLLTNLQILSVTI